MSASGIFPTSLYLQSISALLAIADIPAHLRNMLRNQCAHPANGLVQWNLRSTAMHRRTLLLAGLIGSIPIASAMAQAPAAGGAAQFDGLWKVHQVCSDVGHTKGYTHDYGMVVKNGFARAQWGTDGTNDSWSVSGQIQPDGTATMVVNGITGAEDYAAGNVRSGTPFGYTFPANFTATRGLGNRTIQRPCTFTFTKQ